MIRLLLVFFVLIVFKSAWSIDPFIKTVNDSDAGSKLRVLPTPDNGWVMFSLNQLKLYKFAPCGKLQWSKKYNVSGNTWSSNDFIGTQSGGFAFMTRTLTGSVYLSLITLLDASGNVKWCKTIGDSEYNHFPYTLNENSQGDFILYGNVSHKSNSPLYNMITVVNAAGNHKWTQFYNHGGIWGGAIATSDNGILARTGSRFIKTDNLGNVQWTSNLATASTYNYYAPFEVSDGYIFTTYSTGSNLVNFHKMDKNGNLVGNSQKQTGVAGLPPTFTRKYNGNFVCVFSTSVVEFDKDLNVIHQSAPIPMLAGLQHYGNHMTFLSDQTPLIAGSDGTNPVMIRSDAQYRTQCGGNVSPIELTQLVTIQTFLNTSAFSYPLFANESVCSTDNLIFSQTTLCSVIKDLDLGSDTTFCVSQEVVLKNLSGGIFESYLWSTGATTTSIVINKPGIYWLRVNYNCGENILSDTIVIEFHPSIVPVLGEDILACDQISMKMEGPVCIDCHYQWSTGSTFSTIDVTEPGLYWITVTDSNGCITSDTISVALTRCDCNFYIPSAFTPNQDGKNDVFNLVFDCDMNDFNLKIFNRWGQLIYTSTDNASGWNGKYRNHPVPEGIYLYTVIYEPLIKGKTQNRIIKSGRVSVIY